MRPEVNPKVSLQRVRIVLWLLACSLCQISEGQSGDSRVADFIGKAFSTCGNPTTFYLGPLPTEVGECILQVKHPVNDCMKSTQFDEVKISQGERSKADVANGRYTIIMDYSIRYERLIVDGVWQPRGDALDSPGPQLAGEIKRKGDEWQYTLGPTLYPLGSIQDFSASLVGEQPFNRAFEILRRTKASCDTLKNPSGSNSQNTYTPSRPGPDGFKFLSEIPLDERQPFKPMEEVDFESKFAALLKRANEIGGVPLDSNSREFNYVVSTIKACSKLPPQTFRDLHNQEARSGFFRADSPLQGCRPISWATTQSEVSPSEQVLARRGLFLTVVPNVCGPNCQNLLVTVTVTHVAGDTAHRYVDTLVMKAQVATARN